MMLGSEMAKMMQRTFMLGSDMVDKMRTTFNHLVVIMLGGSDHVRFRQSYYMSIIVNII